MLVYKFRELLIVVTLLCLSASAFSSSTLKYKKISEDRYIFILYSSENFGEVAAKRAIFESAKKVCLGKDPVFGQYRFSGNENLRNDGSDPANQFSIMQEVLCDNSGQSEATLTPKLTAEEEKELKTLIVKLTKQYFTYLEENKGSKAYAMLDEGMRSQMSEASWVESREKIFSASGKLKNRSIWRVSVYIDPPMVKKGIYIAADFDQSYDNIPVYCGYLVWNKNKDEYLISREDYGKIDSDLISKIGAEELKLVKQKIKCDPSK